MKQLTAEILSLQSARGRIIAFVFLSTVIFFCHYHWLDHLSLWGHLGLHAMPSIGLTRAYWLLLHGHPIAAWHRNPLIYAVVLLGIPFLIHDGLGLFRQTSVNQLESSNQ